MRAQTKLYLEFRKAGYTAVESHRNASIVVHFRELEDAGLVRLRAEDEQENYFDVFDEPENYRNAHGRYISADQARKELCDIIDSWGCVYVLAEYRGDDGDEWEHADSIGMCVYRNPLDPAENCYIPQLMLSALRALPREALP